MGQIKKIFKLLLFVFGALVILFVIIDGSFLIRNYDPKNNKNDGSMTDTQFNIIRSGLQAASSHNMQPWLVELVDENTILLYGDSTKLLPVIDPNHWQFLVSQGTFINCVKDYAIKAGIDLKVEYHDIVSVENNPLIATFKFNDGNLVDVISSASLSEEEGKSDIEEVLNSNLESSGFQYRYYLAESSIDLRALLNEGTVIESTNQEAMVELLNVFRFTEWDKNKYKYGLGLNMNQFMLQTFIGPIMKLTAEWESFGTAGIDMFDKRLADEIGHITIHKDQMSSKDYIHLGELISKLTREIRGYTLRPEIQLLQDMDDMMVAKGKLDKLVGQDTVFILGIKVSTPNSSEIIRHNVMDITIK